ncbi:MAG: tyrosine-type recombinase/integrase [Thermoplasmatota archaeon]
MILVPYVATDSLERLLSKIKNEKHRADVRAYLDEKKANGFSAGTQANLASHLRAWGDYLGDKDYRSATKADVVAFMNTRSGRRAWRNGKTETQADPTLIRDTTLNLRRSILRNFHRWLRGLGPTDAYPPEVAWMARRKVGDERVGPEDLITRPELIRLIEAQDHPQDRAILACLYDSGFRANAFTSLQLRDIEMTPYGAKLHLRRDQDGLKRARGGTLIPNATPYLVKWLNDHAFKNDPTAALWIRRDKGGRPSPFGDKAPLGRSGLYNFVSKEGERVLQRHLHPHLFRHSRATECAREGMPESEMRQYFGWSRTSDMPSRYIHLAADAANDGIARRAGLKTTETRVASAILPRVCACGMVNPATADYCEDPRCNRPLTVTAASKREQSVADEMKERLLQEWMPEILQAIQASTPTSSKRRLPDQPRLRFVQS